MQGRYINGLGKAWDDKHPMRFHGDGAANFPYLSDGMWFLTQHKRWGLLKNHPDYAAIAGQINRIDVYKQAAAATGTALPSSPLRSSKLLDGTVWDGSNPTAYADRSEEHTSELQSLMRISYAVFCLKTKKKRHKTATNDMTYNTNS